MPIFHAFLCKFNMNICAYVKYISVQDTIKSLCVSRGVSSVFLSQGYVQISPELLYNFHLYLFVQATRMYFHIKRCFICLLVTSRRLWSRASLWDVCQGGGDLHSHRAGSTTCESSSSSSLGPSWLTGSLCCRFLGFFLQISCFEQDGRLVNHHLHHRYQHLFVSKFPIYFHTP